MLLNKCTQDLTETHRMYPVLMRFRLSGFLSAALRAWNSCNEYMPSRIIVYRDGVGDGQLKTLVNYEVPQFLDCLKSVGRGYK